MGVKMHMRQRQGVKMGAAGERDGKRYQDNPLLRCREQGDEEGSIRIR